MIYNGEARKLTLNNPNSLGVSLVDVIQFHIGSGSQKIEKCDK